MLAIKVKTNSTQTEIRDVDSDFIYVSVAAVPDKEKANKELVKFVSKLFGVSRELISIVSGQHSSTKTVQIRKSMELPMIQDILNK